MTVSANIVAVMQINNLSVNPLSFEQTHEYLLTLYGGLNEHRKKDDHVGGE